MASPPGRKPIQVTDPVHAELSKRAQYLSALLGRAVTFSEVIERLLAMSGTPIETGADR